MHIFHSPSSIKTCIFTAVTVISIVSQYGLREATLYGISVSFHRETTIGVSGSLRSLIKERAFIKSSATTRQSKQKLM